MLEQKKNLMKDIVLVFPMVKKVLVQDIIRSYCRMIRLT